MKRPYLEYPLGSIAEAELADMQEACLRGELSREDFETYLFDYKRNGKRTKNNEK